MSLLDSPVFKEDPLTPTDHLDPDKHWVGEALGVPTQSEIAATIGAVASPGESPYVARADHTHKLDSGILPKFFYIVPAVNTDGTTGTTYVTWLTSPDTFSIPTWSTRALIQVNLTNIYVITAAATYLFNAAVQTGSYVGDYCAQSFGAINDRLSVSYSILSTGLTSGTAVADIRIGCRRASGTGVLRADSSSKITGSVTFLP